MGEEDSTYTLSPPTSPETLLQMRDQKAVRREKKMGVVDMANSTRQSKNTTRKYMA
jgi:hypothetical protein